MAKWLLHMTHTVAAMQFQSGMFVMSHTHLSPFISCLIKAKTPTERSKKREGERHTKKRYCSCSCGECISRLFLHCASTCEATDAVSNQFCRKLSGHKCQELTKDTKSGPHH